MKQNSSQPIPMNLSRLVPHPLQPASFAPCIEAEDAALLADLKANGQRDPIVVMPAGNAANLPAYTILDGHRRTGLLKKLGITEANVLVRDDLKNADNATVEWDFLNYNDNRRQLDPLGKVLVLKRKFELSKKRPQGGLNVWDRQKAREQVKRILEMGGKNAGRYLMLAEAPPEVHAAFRAGHITLILGARIGELPAEKRKDLAERLRGLSDRQSIRQAVQEYLPADGTIHPSRNGTPGVIAFVRRVAAEIAKIRRHLAQASRSGLAPHLEEMLTLRKLLNDIIAHAKRGQNAIPGDVLLQGELELRRDKVGQEPT